MACPLGTVGYDAHVTQLHPHLYLLPVAPAGQIERCYYRTDSAYGRKPLSKSIYEASRLQSSIPVNISFDDGEKGED